MPLPVVLASDAATVYRLHRAIDAAMAPELTALYRVFEGAVTGDRQVLYDLVKITDGTFAANLLAAWDEANRVANEA